MTDLVCIDCGAGHPDRASRCSCGGALDRAVPLGPVDDERLRGTATGLRRFADALGVPASELVTLGEGSTPLIHDESLGAFLKCEGANPTGSFKDRGASLVVSHARRVGSERVTEDSSGNAGAAVAAYAARAGLDCTVFSPEHVTEGKRARMETLGAEVRVVEGPRSGVTDAASKAADQDEGTYYASHTYPPWFVDGCSTLAFEIVRELGGAPDALVTPCAMGSVVLGAYRGFARMFAGDIVDRVPPIYAVQAAGTDPIARRFDGGLEGDNRLADGLLVPEPPREDQLVEAIEDTGGTALSVGEEATREATKRLHRRGVLAEPSSATALAGRDRLVEQGELDASTDAVLVLTGRWSPS